jgi:transmembrane protein 8A/B
MTVTRALLKILNSNMPFNDTLHTNATSPNGYKFFVPRNVDICTVKLTIAKACSECKDINFYVQAHSLPTSKNYLHSAIINVSASNSDDVIEFYPHENTWHYVDLKFFDHFNSSLNGSTASTPSTSSAVTIQSVDYTITLEYQLKKTANEEEVHDEMTTSADDASKYIPLMPKSRNFEEYSLLRQTYREFFMYDYDLVPDANGSVPLAINLTSRAPALMRFDIGDVYDIGGTLTFAISMRTDVMTSPSEATPTTPPSVHIDLNGEPAIAEKLTNEMKFNNQTVVVCIRLNEPGIPTYPDKCAYGRHTYPANTIINNTNEDTGTSVVHIPFPETGTW